MFPREPRIRGEGERWRGCDYEGGRIGDDRVEWEMESVRFTPSKLPSLDFTTLVPIALSTTVLWIFFELKTWHLSVYRRCGPLF